MYSADVARYARDIASCCYCSTAGLWCCSQLVVTPRTALCLCSGSTSETVRRSLPLCNSRCDSYLLFSWCQVVAYTWSVICLLHLVRCKYLYERCSYIPPLFRHFCFLLSPSFLLLTWPLRPAIVPPFFFFRSFVVPVLGGRFSGGLLSLFICCPAQVPWTRTSPQPSPLLSSTTQGTITENAYEYPCPVNPFVPFALSIHVSMVHPSAPSDPALQEKYVSIGRWRFRCMFASRCEKDSDY